MRGYGWPEPTSETSVDPHATHGTRSLVAPHDSSPTADARVRRRCGTSSHAPWPKASQAGRRRPQRMGLPCARGTLPRRLAYLAEHTGLRVSAEPVRRVRMPRSIGLSRPQHQIRSPAPASALQTRRWQSAAIICAPTPCWTLLPPQAAPGRGRPVAGRGRAASDRPPL
jgi:hypothetical protein